MQDSLLSGEQQIGSRYDQDMKELGEWARVGDGKSLCKLINRMVKLTVPVIARDLLLHVTVRLQLVIIESLQVAVKHPNAVLHIQTLYEASTTNREETIVILDQMKQRLYATRPIPRQLDGGSGPRSPFGTASQGGYMPPGVTLVPQEQPKESKLAGYLRMKRSSSSSSKPGSTREGTPIPKPNINYSAALEHLVQRKDRETIEKDIDEIIVSYKNLHVSHHAPDTPWNQNQHPQINPERRGTLDMLNGNGSSVHDMYAQNWPPGQRTMSSPQSYAGQHPTFNQDMFTGQQQYPPFTTANPHPHYQTQMPHRFSDSSTSSAQFSDRLWERNDSESSRSSYAPSDPRYSLQSPPSHTGFSPSTSPTAAFQHMGDHYGQHLSFSTSYAPSEFSCPSPIPPLAVPQRDQPRASPQNGGPVNAPLSSNNTASLPAQNNRDRNSDSQRATRVPDAIAPFSSPPDSPVPKEEDREDSNPSRPIMLSPEARGPPSSHSSSSGHTVTFGVPTMPWQRGTSTSMIDRIRQPSIASTDSSGSGSVGILPRPVSIIPSSTIQSPRPGQERMMSGRPCKDNNYWGFCKGAWDVREDPKKGLALRTMPSGMYNTKEIWECRHCNFRGNTYTVSYPGKKKKETVVDPNIHTSKSGIHYRWVFLAKSHVKKKTPDSAHDECNYGCVFCSVESKVTSIFGNVDTLMYHLLEHVAGMSQQTMSKTKCIVGRTAGPEEDWDVNIPIFADVNGISEMGG